MAETIACSVLGAPEESSATTFIYALFLTGAVSDLFKASPEWELHRPACEIDERDVGTPDGWIPRNPSLARLTGRHPVNAEPPLEQLKQAGFITPVSLHFVRNHGAVPKLDWSSHRVEINGLVGRPMSLTMDDILQFPSVTIAVTMTCSGNRRKEQNMHKKTIGFNWGPTATACSYWTGVRLSDLLRHVRTKGPKEGAFHVCYRGPKGELPKGDDGSFGTSIPLGHAINPANDVILAYKQNGRWLTPDHGFPLRMVIPGFIAGRCVKWLSEITVTNTESRNYYHYHDNRVLPPHVDEALAKKEGWFYKSDFVINELNINSVVASPAHDEIVSLRKNKPYTISGYAYTGGGRRVIRVEISVNSGKSWRQAEIQRMDNDNIYGKSWTWVFWELDVHVFDFLTTDNILVRAVDSSQNIQPSNMTWSVMGMMNNCQFKVCVHKHLSGDGDIAVRFQHPAPSRPGPLGNVGWKEEERDTTAFITPPPPRAIPISPKPPPTDFSESTNDGMYTMEEVAEHNTEKSCWFVHEGKVYDATSYLSEHPGGVESILLEAGSDATLEFNSIHSVDAKKLLKKFYIGDVRPTDTTTEVKPEPKEEIIVKEPAPVALHPKKKLPFALSERIELSHNVRLFRFALQSPEHVLGLPIGQHMFIYANINGQPCMRAYTPTSSDDDAGHFDLVVKIYRAGEHPKFPDGGKMSQYLDTLKIGDTIDVRGPTGHFSYVGHGNYVKNRKPASSQQLSMIAGGTGITPMYQVIKAILKDPTDRTQIKLLYANRCIDDILLHQELEELASKHENFDVWYTLDIPPEKWPFSKGYISKEMLEESMFAPTEDGLVLLCGPKPMIDYACKPNLEQLGWDKTQMVEF